MTTVEFTCIREMDSAGRCKKTYFDNMFAIMRSYAKFECRKLLETYDFDDVKSFF